MYSDAIQAHSIHADNNMECYLQQEDIIISISSLWMVIPNKSFSLQSIGYPKVSGDD